MIYSANVESARLLLSWDDVNLEDKPSPHYDDWKLSWFASRATEEDPVDADQLWRYGAYWYHFRFEYADWTDMGGHWRRVGVPMWFITGIVALPVAAGLRGRMTRRRGVRRGLCPFCGYDLRATPQQCPECGAVERKPEMPA